MRRSFLQSHFQNELKFIFFLSLRGTNYGKQKGRELVAPFSEAPRSAFVMNAPSRAVWRVLGLSHHCENSRFSEKTVA